MSYFAHSIFKSHKFLFDRPNITEINPRAYLTAYQTQSQNASAKMGLIVDEFYVNYVDSRMKQKPPDWTRLENTVLFTYSDAFVFHADAFYFRAFDKVINNLIPTGVINYLIENYFTKKWKFPKVDKEPKVLSLDDLSFGFNIWLGTCFMSIFVFFWERLINCHRAKKIKFIKIHPSDQVEKTEVILNLKPELIETFRVKRDTKNLIQLEVREDKVAIDAECKIVFDG